MVKHVGKKKKKANVKVIHTDCHSSCKNSCKFVCFLNFVLFSPNTMERTGAMCHCALAIYDAISLELFYYFILLLESQLVKLLCVF